MEVAINGEDEIVMKLLHFFITEKGYNPIVLHGANNEIWLENLNSDYEIIRIVTNYIHNNEQLDFDIFKTRKILKKIGQKTFSFNMNTLSIFLNLGENINFEDYVHLGNIDCVNISEIKDLLEYDFVKEQFPDILKNTRFKEKGVELFLKLTEEISLKSEAENKKAEDVFTIKKPIVTYILIGINILMFLLMYLFGNGSTDITTLLKFGASYAPYIKNGELYRLITSAFLHIGIIHLAFNMYALYILGSQLESFYGKGKYLLIYMFSALTGNLMSMIFLENGISAGASGAIFGLFGALLYFGYHYRVYLGTTIRSTLIPILLFNFLLGFLISGIDVSCHIGGFIGGALISMALGVKYKSDKTDKINGIILSIIFLIFLGFLAFR